MRILLACTGALLIACSSDRAQRPPITIFAAASLARPLEVVADSFTATQRSDARVELGGSLEIARKLTDLGRIPDVVLLADDAVMASLMPAHIGWYVRFATSPLVIAYRDGSQHAGEITGENWTRVLSRDGVRVGRADSAIAPAGRHALALIRRLDGYYGVAGATAGILANSPAQMVRPNATELAALLEAGSADYIVDYESVARQYGFRYISLPRDLAPVVIYGASVPRAATNALDARDFLAVLFSPVGRSALRDAHVQVLRTPVAVGDSVPPAIMDVVRMLADTSATP